MAMPQSLLKGLQIPERQDSFMATAIQRQDALGTGAHEVEILRELAVSGGAWGTGSGHCESILAPAQCL